MKKVNGVDKLISRGWIWDGLWLTSPYTGHRYAKSEALAVEELREWSGKNGAILDSTKSHSMWVVKEQQDNELCSFDDLNKKYKHRLHLKDLASRSNLSKVI